MSSYIKDEEKVLEIAKALGKEGILATHGNFFWHDVWFARDGERYLKFAIKSNRKWSVREMTKIVTEAFNKYGFKATTRSEWGYVWVEVEPFEVELRKNVDVCFLKVMSEWDL